MPLSTGKIEVVEGLRMFYYVCFSAILILLFAFPAVAFAQAPERREVIRYAAESGEGAWRRANEIPENLTSRELFTYALALCEADMHSERLGRLFDLGRRMQDRDPDSRGYGNFRWYWSEVTVKDFNAVEFCMQAGSLLWLRHREKMPEKAREVLRDVLEYAVQGCLNHRVSESYTNIALMNAENLILLGEALDKPEVADEGYERLDRICLYTWEAGIHEYCSPTYYGVDLDCLWLIEAFCQRERGREQARALLELIWTDIALNWSPASQRLGGARSRDYDYLRGRGHLDVQMWVSGWLPGEPRGGTGAIYPALARWQPPEHLRDMNVSRFPRLVRQSWGIGVNHSRTHYLLSDVTLSTAGANYGPMDLPLTVDLPGDRDYLRCYFIPDARRDPYGKKKIPAGAHQKTLHLRPFWAAAQRGTDALGIVIYRERDLPEDPVTLESHFVMPLDVDGFWIGEQQVNVQAGRRFVLPFKTGDSLVLRKGTAAVGVRVPWSRGLAKQPEMAFIYDGNEHGAVRLTVAHHDFWGVAALTPNAGAAFWVRIGSGLETEEAFHQWRRTFADAHAEVEASLDRVFVRAEGVDGSVVLGTQAPYTGTFAIEPAPSRAVLELDGEDIGRRILQNIEPIKSYKAQMIETEPMQVSAEKGIYWEAESGQVMPPMTVSEDANASGGKYVWMPGEPGGRGGSILGSVTWRLTVPKAGTYHVWGRILAPTPEDDSFFVRAFTHVGEIVSLSEWHTGTHAQWEWTRMTLNLAEKLTPLALPEGEVNFQLRVREDGTKIDRLFITPSLDEEPGE